MLKRASPLAAWLDPLAPTLWALFFIWTVFVAALWTTGIGEIEIANWRINDGLRSALEFACKISDGTWFAIGAANVYLCLAETHGLATARRWTLLVLIVGVVVTALSVWTGQPLGHIRYGGRLGARLGPVPMAMPLLWLCVAIGARDLFLRISPRAGPLPLTFGAGALALLSDLNVEPLATRVRGLWSWYSPVTHQAASPPLSNYITWFVATAFIAFVLREPVVGAARKGGSEKALIVLGLINCVALLTHVVLWLRR